MTTTTTVNYPQQFQPMYPQAYAQPVVQGQPMMGQAIPVQQQQQAQGAAVPIAMAVPLQQSGWFQ